MDRRDFLRFTSGTLAAAWWFPFGGNKNTLLEKLRRGHSTVVPVNPDEATSQIELVRAWDKDCCKFSVVNRGKQSVRIKEVVLCDTVHNLPAETHLYGESFQMLSQIAGTLGS